MSGLLDKERIVAKPGFNRWLVLPAALAIHLSIGQAYAYSVFKLPLTRALGITESGPGDWTQTQIALVFTIFIVFLGLSAAVFGRWLERVGPRKAGVAAAFCWGGGVPDLRNRRPHPPALAPVSRQRGDWWVRTRTGIHLTGFHPHQVVPGPPRHGNRHGDHGIRRRCHDPGRRWPLS